MIGLALGLFVVGGGLLMLAGFTDENRRLLLETRLNQDLRAASDVVTRDLRRAGYWTPRTVACGTRAARLCRRRTRTAAWTARAARRPT